MKTDDTLLTEILTQGRLRGLSLILANQRLEQINDKILQKLLSNTVIKMIGIMSDKESEKLGNALDLESKDDFTNNIKKGQVGRWMVLNNRPEGCRNYYELNQIEGTCKTFAENE